MVAAHEEHFAIERGWVLEGQDGEGGPCRFVLGETELSRAHLGLVIGRHPELCDHVLADGSLSKRHCRFSLADGDLAVEDLNSLNGTLVDGAPISKFHPEPLYQGETLTLGRVRLMLRRLDER